MPRLKPQAVVTVYKDPVACTEIEGTAILKTFYRSRGPLVEYWLVHFIDDPEGDDCARWINTRDHSL